MILGSVSNDNASCENCSQEFSRYAEDTAGVARLHTVISSSRDEMSRRTVLHHLCVMISQCKPPLVFLLYRYVFKPILDSFYTNRSGNLVISIFGNVYSVCWAIYITDTSCYRDANSAITNNFYF